MDEPDITMEEYVQLESERALRNGKVYNWETATYGKIWESETKTSKSNVHDFRLYVQGKILAIKVSVKVETGRQEILRDLDQQMEKRADDGKANVVTVALSRKERVKPRRVRAMAMTIQYGVRGMILTAQSEAFKQKNVLAEILHGLDPKMEKGTGDESLYLWMVFRLSFGGSEILVTEAMASRLRWMIYLMVLADAAESVRDTIGFEYYLASSQMDGQSDLMIPDFRRYNEGMSPVLWAEIGESSLTGPELVLDTTDKVGESGYANVALEKVVIRFGEKGFGRVHPDEGEVQVVGCFFSFWSGYAAMRTLLWAGKVSGNFLVNLRRREFLKRRGYIDPTDDLSSMSPPRRQRYRWNIAFATGCRRMGRMKRTNRRIRVPAFMRSYRIEEELTLVKTFGKEVEEYVTKVIAKDGTVTRFEGRFPQFIEEEEEKKPKPYNLYGFVDLMENEQVYAKNGFAPHRIPQPEGNHNGWLSEEEEADSDSESTASNHPHTG
ncbi:hypothetical protein Tco_0066290 [Tanacetum coccineum]